MLKPVGAAAEDLVDLSGIWRGSQRTRVLAEEWPVSPPNKPGLIEGPHGWHGPSCVCRCKKNLRVDLFSSRIEMMSYKELCGDTC